MSKNNTILITGGNGGIGSSIGEMFLKQNKNVIFFYNKNRQKLDEMIQNNPSFKDRSEFYQVDLTNFNNLENTLQKIIQSNNIDCFIHSVTPSLNHKTFEKLEWSDFQLHLDVHLRSFYSITKSILPNMKNQKYGRIISILTSYCTGVPPKQLSHYTTAKYALLGMIKSLAIELAAYRITVNGVSPNLTDTPLISNLPSKLKEIHVMRSPNRRLVKPQDVSGVVNFLESQISENITGENILVSGGLDMH